MTSDWPETGGSALIREASGGAGGVRAVVVSQLVDQLGVQVLARRIVGVGQAQAEMGEVGGRERAVADGAEEERLASPVEKDSLRLEVGHGGPPCEKGGLPLPNIKRENNKNLAGEGL